MKRTVQRPDRTEQSMPENVSGCRQFEGEDLSKFLCYLNPAQGFYFYSMTAVMILEIFFLKFVEMLILYF